MNTLLLVEPSAIIRFSFKSMLIGEGYNVYDYARGSDWLKQRHADGPVDLAVISADDGSEAISFMQEAEQDRQAIPMVVLLPELRKDTFTQLVRYGAVDILLKPLPAERLVSRIKAYLPAGFPAFRLEDWLRLELARAARGGYPFSLLAIAFDREDPASLHELEQLQAQCRRLLRCVDLATVAGNRLIVQLPFTGRIGLQIVLGKMAGLQPLFPYLLKAGGASFPEECTEADQLLELARIRMQNSLHTKEVEAKIRNQARRTPRQTVSTAPPSRTFRDNGNALHIRSFADRLGVRLEWDNAIGSKWFQLKRFTGNTLDYSKKVFVNRYRDHYTRCGMTHTYVISGISKHTGLPIEAFVRVHVGDRS